MDKELGTIGIGKNGPRQDQQYDQARNKTNKQTQNREKQGHTLDDRKGTGMFLSTFTTTLTFTGVTFVALVGGSMMTD